MCKHVDWCAVVYYCYSHPHSRVNADGMMLLVKSQWMLGLGLCPPVYLHLACFNYTTTQQHVKDNTSTNPGIARGATGFVISQRKIAMMALTLILGLTLGCPNPKGQVREGTPWGDTLPAVGVPTDNNPNTLGCMQNRCVLAQLCAENNTA